MKSNFFDGSKRKFVWMGAAALASLKLIKSPGAAQAIAKTPEGKSISLEERVALLEQENASQKHEISRLQDINKIENLMGRYEAIHTGVYIEKTWELFARHTPNTWMDVADWGVYVGIDSIRNRWEGGSSPAPQGDSGQPPMGAGNAPPPGGGQAGGPNQQSRGFFAEHPLTTPVIQVAGDGQTAKALWWSLGVERGGWAYGKYGNDFVKEDGMWRIWHLKWFRVFITPWDQSYEESQDPEGRNGAGADLPIKFHKPYNSDKWAGEAIPPAPKPYDTWTEKDEGWQYRMDDNWGDGTVISVPK